MKLICVDDEPLVLQLTMTMCKKLPQQPEVTGFQNAEDTLAYLADQDPAHTAELALLDINLPDMNGLLLAAKIKEIQPDMLIIFLTGYSQYAVDAFSLHVSGYLMKPVNFEKLSAEVEYALARRTQYRQEGAAIDSAPAGPDRGSASSAGSGNEQQARDAAVDQEKLVSISVPSGPMPAHIAVHSFGNFDLIVDGKTVHFSRSKAKELMAYLVDRQGSSITRAEAFSTLWEDEFYDRAMQKQFDVIIRSLRQTLAEYHISEVFEMKNGFLRICPEMIDCDLYHFFNGDIEAVNAYRGEYMSSYSWASLTEAYMDRIQRTRTGEEDDY